MVSENFGESARRSLSFPEKRVKSPVISALMNARMRIVSMKSSER
jgi:hypothetical protein